MGNAVRRYWAERACARSRDPPSGHCGAQTPIENEVGQPFTGTWPISYPVGADCRQAELVGRLRRFPVHVQNVTTMVEAIIDELLQIRKQAVATDEARLGVCTKVVADRM